MLNSEIKNEEYNSSITGGYLKPMNKVLEGASYEDFLKRFLTGITGFESSAVIVQNNINSEPEENESKLLFYLNNSNGDDAPYLENINDDEVLLHRTFTDVWQLTFQGQDHLLQAQRFEDAVHIYQNRHDLRMHGVAIKEVTVVDDNKEELTGSWLQTKVQLVLKREVKRVYQIFNFAAVECELNSMRESLL